MFVVDDNLEAPWMASFDAETGCHGEFVDLLLERVASTTTKNKRGESAIDVVSAPWSDALAETYRSVGKAIGWYRQLDVERI